MAGNRISYPSHALAVKPRVPTEGSYVMAHGLQVIGVNTTFPSESIQEIGQLEVYEILEDVPEVEITTEKVLDGNPPVGILATQNALAPTLVKRADTRADFTLNIYDDTVDAATGVPLSQCEMSGEYLSSWGFTFNTDGAFIENCTFQGNDKRWLTGEFTTPITVPTSTFGTDSPPKSINRREDFLWGTDAGLASTTILPTGIFGMAADGTNDTRAVHVTSVTVNVDLNRESIFQLGDRSPYYRSATFPVDVNTEITINGVSGDMIEATEAGVLGGGNCGASNLPQEEIRIATCEGLRIYLGTKNKLTDVRYTGGDAAGGNVSITYVYIGKNTFTVGHTGDPDTTLRPGGADAAYSLFGASGA